MVKFTTQHGNISVKDWGYRLQGRDGSPLNANALADERHDLIVMDFSRDGTDGMAFSAGKIADIQNGPGGPSVVAGYLSIGEASGFRSHWQDNWTDLPVGWTEADGPKASYSLTAFAPDWLGPTNPDWPESRKVRYWDADWQDVIFNDSGTGWLDKIVAQGFDAAFLDIVDAYYFWGEEVKPGQQKAGDPVSASDAAERMMTFIVALAAHARKTNPDFFLIQQNAEFIVADLGAGHGTLKTKYYDAIGAIVAEDTYFRGGKDENNNYKPDNDKRGILKSDYLNKDIPVFVVDYLNKNSKIEQFQDKALKDGFIPYAAPTRDLDRMAAPFGSEIHPTIGSDALTGSGGDNRIKGLAGDDTLSGRGGDDTLIGSGGEDVLKGSSGDDRLFGDGGDDKLFGGAGADKLVAGDGDDRLAGGGGNDTLNGNGGGDQLSGNGGKDNLHGKGGFDTLDGGGGNDHLFGGTGRDTYKFKPGSGADRIHDFEDGRDLVNLKAFDFASIAEAKSFAKTSHGDVVFIFSSGARLTIDDITKADLTDADLLI